MMEPWRIDELTPGGHNLGEFTAYLATRFEQIVIALEAMARPDDDARAALQRAATAAIRPIVAQLGPPPYWTDDNSQDAIALTGRAALMLLDVVAKELEQGRKYADEFMHVHGRS